MSVRITRFSFAQIVCVGMVLLNCNKVPAQNLFVADAGCTNVYEFTPSGEKSVFVSLPGAPLALAFNSAGDLFVAGGADGNVYEFTPSGTQTTFASGLSFPSGLAFNSAGDLFVADEDGYSIYEFTPDGTRTTFASGLGTPDGLAFNSAGDLFEADWASGYIYEFSTNGTRTIFASEQEIYGPYDSSVSPYALAFDGTGNLFVGNDNTLSHYIVEFAPNGTQGTFVSSGLTTACGLAFDNAGNLFEADYESGNIYEFTPDGTRSTFASGLVNPIALAFQLSPVLTLSITNGAFQVTTAMPSPYHSTIVQTSTNLVNWVNVYTNTPPFTYSDLTTTNWPNRFYRAVLGP